MKADESKGSQKSKKKEEDKYSLTDIASLYGISRQRFDTSADIGAEVVETLKPLVARHKAQVPAKKVIGSTVAFTHANATKWESEEGTYRVCVCCETTIDPEDDEVVISLMDRQEIAWCSRECSVALPIDAWLLSMKYKKHWSVVALDPTTMNDRRLIRDITVDRLESLRELAIAQGYGPRSRP